MPNGREAGQGFLTLPGLFGLLFFGAPGAMGATIDFAAFRTFVTFTHLISLHSTLPRGQLFVVGYQLRRISAYPKAATSEFTLLLHIVSPWTQVGLAKTIGDIE
jgi:hypothetical protein